jgi:hypothetical protein
MTSQDYKATPELWAHMECCADNPQDIATLLLELRSRVEALEEAENDRRFEAAKALIDKHDPQRPRVLTVKDALTNAPTDQELLELMPETMQDEFSYAAKVCSDATGSQVKPGIFRVCLNHTALEYARAVLNRYAHTSQEDLDG